VQVQVTDALADSVEAQHEYGITLVPFRELKPATAMVVAVAHADYRKMSPAQLRQLLKEPPLVIDVKSIFSRAALEASGILLWRL